MITIIAEATDDEVDGGKGGAFLLGRTDTGAGGALYGYRRPSV